MFGLAHRSAFALSSLRPSRVAAAVVVLLGLAAWTIAGGVPAGASSHKRYTADVAPHAVAAGAAATFTATLRNGSDQQSFGSGNITAPAGFVLTGASQPLVDGSPRGSATVKGSVLELRNLSVPAGGTVTAAFTATVPCTSGAFAWATAVKQANNFAGPPGNDFTLDPAGSDLGVTVTGACAAALRFFAEPADAERDTTITSVPGDPGGAPVAVEVVDAGGNRVTTSSAAVTLAIGAAPAPGATLSGTATRSAVAGLAVFDDLRIDLAGPGYTLVASSAGLASATSTPFQIWDEVETCAANVLCTASVDSPDGLMRASIAVTSTTSGALFASLGAVELDCGDPYNHAPSTLTVDSVGLDGEKTVTMTVAKAYDQLQANNGVAHYQVCFEGEAPFTDRDGNTVLKGLLPDCAAATPTPPCVLSKTKTVGGDVLIKVLLPEGDPNMR